MPELMWYKLGGPQGLTSGLGLLAAGIGDGGGGGVEDAGEARVGVESVRA